MKATFITISILAASSCMLPASVTLVEIDFSGSATTVIPSTDAQFTVKNAAINFTSTQLTLVGGGSGAGGWAYDGTGTAAANIDLHTSSTFGSPTRFDFNLGFANSGQSYTINSVELDIRAANTSASWEFGYRDTSNVAHLVGLQAISTQSGQNPISTYSIDLTGEGLTATDSTLSWVNSGTGNLRWMFFESNGTNNDNFQVDAIRVIGTVIPEPGTPLIIGALSLVGLIRRRR
jgi:hypothetical protein